MILHEYKIFNAEVLFREDCTADELIDVISANRVYMPCLYVYNKIDQISIEEVDKLARRPNACVVRYAPNKTKYTLLLSSDESEIFIITNISKMIFSARIAKNIPRRNKINFVLVSCMFDFTCSKGA